MTKEAYVKLFPNDVYSNEDQFINWKKGKLMKVIDFNTEEEKAIEFTEHQKWNAGNYVVEIESSDQFGNDIEQKQFFVIDSHESSELPIQVLHYYQPIRTKANPTEEALLAWGSSMNNAKAFLEVEKDGKIVSEKWWTLSNKKEVEEFLAEETDRGNFFVHLTHIRLGRSFIENQTIEVPLKSKKLDVELSTFRNKLEPGSKEEWAS